MIPPRPPRDTRLDIVRGWLQLTIFASHATGSFIGGWMIHASWGLSDSSEQFVFLSGFTLGSVFARKAAGGGWRAGATDLVARTRRLYLRQILIFVLFGLMIAVATAALLPGEAERLGWAYGIAHPLRAMPGVLLMLYQPADMGILPVFVWCMLLLPGFAWLEVRWGGWALLPSLFLYAAAYLLDLSPPGLYGTGIGFNPFAWQLLYLTGAWLGRRALLAGEALPFRARWAPWVTAGAILVVTVGLVLRLAWYGFLPFDAPIAQTRWVVGKETLALPRILHAWALAWLVAYVVPRNAAWMGGAVLRATAVIGRHSLDVFCLGLFLSWAATTVFRLVPYTPGLDIVVIGAGCLILAAFAEWRERRREAARVMATA
ncbi:MAG TPA: OpgC domain-containing protein [Acetobacteraceae bacterium]|nr:OpgC domain-containing protein [Acetobacteraceae bacterium]